VGNALSAVYPEYAAGGFTRYDGSIQFYGRVNALLSPDMNVLDLGAGRGAQFEGQSPFRKNLVVLRGKVAKVTGVDVDDAVLNNPELDEALVYDGARLPFADGSFDLVLSDWVLEHVEDPAIFSSEIDRVLKPGGWFCARTPSILSYTAFVSRLVPNRLHATVLGVVQKGNRKPEDVFPAAYKLNSLRSVRRYFPADRWNNHSYTYSPEPAYHFNSPLMVRVMAIAQYLKKPIADENLLVFVQKK
jgi:SAM-dependent methyltransferase